MKTVAKIMVSVLITALFNSCILEHEEPDSPLRYHYIPARQLRLTHISSTKVQVEWTNAMANISGGIPTFYGTAHPKINIVERRSSHGTYNAIATINGDSTSIIDQQLDSLKSYTYRIRSQFNDTIFVISDTMRIKFGFSYPLEYSITPKGVYGIAAVISPDENYIAATYNDAKIHILNIKDGSTVREFSSSNYIINLLRYNTNGQYIATIDGYYDSLTHLNKPQVSIYNASTGSLLRTFRNHESINSILFNLNGSELIIGGYKPSFTKWTFPGGVKIGEFNPDSIYVSRVAINSEGSVIASGNFSNGMIHLLNANDGSLIRKLAGSNYVISIAFSNDGRYLATGSYSYQIEVWDISDGNKITHISNQLFYDPTALTFTPDNQFVFCGDYYGVIRIWKISDGSLVGTLTGHSRQITELKISKDGSKLFSSGIDKINVWSLVKRNIWLLDL